MIKPAIFPGKIKPYTLANIVRIHGFGNYSLIHMTDGRQLMLSYTLKRYVECLPDFVRSHKSHLVNPKFVLSVNSYGDAGWLVMTNSANVPISRRAFAEVKQKIHTIQIGWKEANQIE